MHTNKFQLMKFYFIFSLVLGSLLFVGTGKASAATYYVSPTGSNTAPYDTWAKAANLPSTAITAGNTDVGGDGPHIMYIAPGTYVNYISIIDIDWANGTIIGTMAHGSTVPAVKGQVIISATAGQNGFYTNRDNVSVSNISITGTDAAHDGIVVSASGFVGSNIYVYSSGRYGLIITTNGNATFWDSLFDRSTDYNIYSGVAEGVGVFNHSIVSNGLSGGVTAKNGATVTFNNSDIVNNEDRAIFDSNGTVNLVNSVVVGNGGYGGLFSNGASASISYKNSYIFGNGGDYAYNIISLNGGSTTDLGGNVTSLPNFVAWKNGNTYFSLTFDDDSNSPSYFQDVVNSTKVPITIFAAYPESYSAGDITTLIGLKNAGNEIGVHSWTHSDLAATTAFTISSTNTNPSIDVDIATSQLILSCDEVGNRITIDWSATDKTIGDLRTAVATKGWIITNTTNVKNIVKLSSLADTSGQQTVFPYTVNLDVTAPNYAYWRNEIIAVRDWLVANVGSISTVMAYPFSSNSADLETYLSNSVMTGARNGGTNDLQLRSLNIYNVNNYGRFGFTTSSTEAQIRTAARNLYVFAKSRGIVATIYGHYELGELSAVQWGYITDEIKASGGTFSTFGSIISAIRLSHSTTDNMVYTKSYTDNSDFHLLPTSSFIDSGTDVSLTTDYAGNSIYGAPDIGAYEYQPPYTFATNDIPQTGAARLYSDGKYRMTTASSTTATANFSVTPAEGTYYATTTQYMDITINTWDTTGDKNKMWTATSTTGDFLTHATSTIYTIGDLLPDTYYSFKLDSTASTTAITNNTQCTNGICLSDSSGNIVFTYTGGYSTHTFALEKDVTGPSAFTLSSPANNSSVSARPTLSWNLTSDSESGLAKYQLYINNTLNQDNISASATSIIPASDLTCGGYTWFIRAIDNAGNATDSNTYNMALLCGGMPVSSPPTPTIYQTYDPNTGETTTGEAPIQSTPAIVSPVVPVVPSVADTNSKSDITLEQMIDDTTIIITGDVNQIVAEIGIKRDLASERLFSRTIVEGIVKDTGASDQTRNAITNFVTYGTLTTQPLGAGERAGVVNSFKSAFGRLPTTQEDWNDVIKIANGRWPGSRDEKTEKNAEAAFKKIYLRNPDRTNARDDAAIIVMAYGLRPANRNLESEKAAIKTFNAVYGYYPKTAMAWDIVRAIAYSGAKR